MAETVVGLISDTHGLLRPVALEALAGCERILHAGDVGDAEILKALGAVAPVTAVQGNVDEGTCGELPVTQMVEIAGVKVYVIHDIHDMDIDPEVEGMAAVIFGHSHKPVIREVAGVLFVNPGSAGPRRFRLPISVGKLFVEEGRVRAELVTLG